jgi:hypothetical protein
MRMKKKKLDGDEWMGVLYAKKKEESENGKKTILS